jgi:hypothetical protein
MLYVIHLPQEYYFRKQKLPHDIPRNPLAKSSTLSRQTRTEGRRSDLVAGESESSASDLTEAEPSIQLEAKQRGDASVLDVQVIPVFPQLLHLVGLLQE